jgi:putative transcriptional regulator
MNTHLKLKNRLKEYRQRAKLTQSELAKLVSTSKNTISSIETGQFCPTAYLAALLCIALECKFEELFYLDME